MRAEDYPWLDALTTPQLATGNAARLRQEGVSPEQADRGVAVVARELLSGPRTRLQLREALEVAGVPVTGQAQVHVLVKATLQGICVRGPVVGKDQAFVLVRDWLPPAPKVDRDQALRWLAERYLTAHGPSTERDLAKWAGIPLGDARRALIDVAAPPLEPGPLPGPTLLGGYDEVLMGWESRSFVLGDQKAVVTMNGIFKPIALVKGKAVATWGLPGRRVALEPFAALSTAVQRALEKDAQGVERFLAG